MSPIALVLVLSAAAIHAAWNRLLVDMTDRVAVMAVASVAGSLILLPALLTSPPLSVLALVCLSGIVEAAYALALTAAYTRGALSLTYPIGRGTAPLLVTVGAWFALGQAVSLESLAGAATLGAGLVLVATAGRAPEWQAAVGFALLTGLCVASYSLIDARAVRHASPAGYLSAVLAVEAACLTMTLQGDGQRWKAALRPGIVVAIGTVGAYLLVLIAFRLSGAGRVATLRELAVVFALMLARERPAPRAWLGASMVALGAILTAT